MPDDDKMLAKMFSDKSKDGYTFMWNQWGVNWITLSVVKLLAVSSGNIEFMKVGFAHDVVTNDLADWFANDIITNDLAD